LGFKGRFLFFLALGLTVGGAALAGRPGSSEKSPPAAPPTARSGPAEGPGASDRPTAEKPRPVPETPAEPARETFSYAGRVLGPEGKPLPGAKVFISGLNPGVIEFRERTTSGPDGTFRFTVRRDEFGDKGFPPGRSPPERFVFIGALATGYGTACV